MVIDPPRGLLDVAEAQSVLLEETRFEELPRFGPFPVPELPGAPSGNGGAEATVAVVDQERALAIAVMMLRKPAKVGESE
jgi:hypothetical protein